MTPYQFDMIPYDGREKDVSAIQKSLIDRPYLKMKRSFADDAQLFIPGERLVTAMNAAIAIGSPLLVTGEPGVGKTQTAYYAAFKLGLEPVIEFHVKSDTKAMDLLYRFDMVRYYGDAHLGKATGEDLKSKGKYIEKGPLWEAFENAKNRNLPQVILIDEIDKAPRDFPNDLLHELDKMEFVVKETGEPVRVDPKYRPIVFITSNSERRLPEPFLRRCVYHHIRFDKNVIEKAVEARRNQYSGLTDEAIVQAINLFIKLRNKNLRKIPATGELLDWLSLLSAEDIKDVAQTLKRCRDLDDFPKIPHLGALIKDRGDLEEMKALE